MLLYLANVKRKILIASFLKPVNDIRSYEKIAKSLAKNKSYDVYCVGYPSNIELSDKNITLFPLTSFKKNVISRIIARWQVFNIYLKLKPELIIVNSPDLLIFTVLYKILFGGKIIYDIRENYFKNLWYQQNYKLGVKYLLAVVVRTKEALTAPLFNHFFLAEKVYASQLRFIKNKFLILENKSLPPQNINSKPFNPHAPKFLISGTIAREYGVFEGINFFKKILANTPNSTLKIIGHCPNIKLINELEIIAEKISSIRLNISKNPIPHTTIIDEILNANFGLLPYLPNKSIEGKWPTKLYEYSSYKLPIIIQENTVWNEFVISTNCGLTFDYTEITSETIQLIWKKICHSSFFQKSVPAEIMWASEEKKLLTVSETLLQ